MYLLLAIGKDAGIFKSREQGLFAYDIEINTSRRISEALADIGSEDAKRRFFREYCQFLERSDEADSERNPDGVDDGILTLNRWSGSISRHWKAGKPS